MGRRFRYAVPLCPARPVPHRPHPVCQASRAQILKKAAEYIQSMRRKNTSHQQDIEDLRKQNRVLEDQSECAAPVTASLTRLSPIGPVVRQLEKGKSSSGFATSLLEKQKNDSISSLDGISDSEAGTSDGDTGNADGMEYMAETGEPSPKRAKTETSERPVGAKVAAVRA